MVFFFIIAVPFPLCTYYKFFLSGTGLFYAIFHFVLKIFGGLSVHPVSRNTFISFFYINLSIALYLNRFLFPEGIPFTFINPIYLVLKFDREMSHFLYPLMEIFGPY